MQHRVDLSPGMRVHGTDGAIGTVEDVHRAGDAALLVRSEADDRLYRIPLSLVSTVKPSASPPVVVLDVRLQEVHRYSVGDGATVADAADQASATELRIPVHTEQLVAEKRPIMRGMVHLHKGVETIEQTMQVPVAYEEAVIERIAPEEFRPDEPGDPDVIVIPVYEEQLVVEKRMVLKEYVRVRKQRREAQQTITDTVRREFVEVTETAAPA
ncbi:MAG TPA: YsnF/AvaK domain-containing protein [Chloroflexota bacterium]|nr:YsnF/AvaK domain-containing protein [Chloroflexota bacterium]